MKNKLLGQGQVQPSGKKAKKQQMSPVAVENPFTEEVYEKMQSEWNVEKEALNKEKEELMQLCQEMQNKIKLLTESAKK